jgi:ankyrin repeat protein
VGGGHHGMIRYFLDQGFPITAADYRGNTPLHHAAASGHLAAASLLLASGAPPDDTNRNTWTPLHKAASAPHNAIISLLCSHGASVDSHSDEGFTPLHHVVLCGDPDIVPSAVEILLNAGSSLHSTDSHGWSALHMAVKRADLNIVHTLLKHGANPNILNFDQQTPLTLAVMANLPEVVGVLLDYGGDPELHTGPSSLLFLSRSQGYTRVAELLEAHPGTLPTAAKNIARPLSHTLFNSAKPSNTTTSSPPPEPRPVLTQRPLSAIQANATVEQIKTKPFSNISRNSWSSLASRTAFRR